jgi:dolichyl-phosphate beta-glucosyltransferase
MSPASELLRILGALEAREADVSLGARVQLLGSDVRRNRWRHYLGRIFASVASIILDVPVYDTQCGAKVFRDNGALRSALSTPFASRWAFDVELLGRLLAGGPGIEPLTRERFVEVPLQEWRDVPGSKLRASSMIKSGLELTSISSSLRARRAANRRGR